MPLAGTEPGQWATRAGIVTPGRVAPRSLFVDTQGDTEQSLPSGHSGQCCRGAVSRGERRLLADLCVRLPRPTRIIVESNVAGSRKPPAGYRQRDIVAHGRDFVITPPQIMTVPRPEATGAIGPRIRTT